MLVRSGVACLHGKDGSCKTVQALLASPHKSISMVKVIEVIAALVCMLQIAIAHRQALDKPNFIMLFVDDLGYGDVGFTGHPTTQTPHLDSLAWHGKILTHWYSACPVCSASRESSSAQT